MTVANVSFALPEYDSDDTLQAVFSWDEAVFNTVSNGYGVCRIYDPTGLAMVQEWAMEPTGAKTLLAEGTKDGIWTARIRIWDGSEWIDKVDYTLVGEIPEPPPPEPPPPEPPPETYTVLIHTIPVQCYVDIEGFAGMLSDASGLAPFYNVPAGSHHITVTKTGYDTQTYDIIVSADTEFTFDISSVPDFWEDPIGWIQYFVISTMDLLLGWTSGSFVSLLYNIKSFFDTYWGAIASFFSDVTGNIQDAMSGIISGIESWLDTSFANIGEWWDSTASDIGEWWNSTTKDMGEWWEGVSGEIGDWWTGSWEDITNAVRDTVEGFVDWSSAQLQSIWDGIQDWVVDLIMGLIDSFNTGFDQGIEDQRNLRREEED